ncbi:hypothetical protein HaLaN_31395 [Haematococcus lacustris]|uniref:Uncharacterized protein n=1 Tax=Haematococcus lacustris TaxID=44745 RepID=A0A6A0AIW6_HAELA|nr:hypothetical protein HaLaN_31395 [Haematococcus lacustris]
MPGQFVRTCWARWAPESIHRSCSWRQYSTVMAELPLHSTSLPRCLGCYEKHCCANRLQAPLPTTTTA